MGEEELEWLEQLTVVAGDQGSTDTKVRLQSSSGQNHSLSALYQMTGVGKSIQVYNALEDSLTFKIEAIPGSWLFGFDLHGQWVVVKCPATKREEVQSLEVEAMRMSKSVSELKRWLELQEPHL